MSFDIVNIKLYMMCSHRDLETKKLSLFYVVYDL